MKSFPTIINHIQTQSYISSFLPPIQSLLNNLNISLQTKPQPNPQQFTQEIQLHSASVDMYTDASLHKSLRKECCAIHIPQINFSKQFAPHSPISSTSFELQAILSALQLCKNTPIVNLFTDFLSAIQAIKNFHKKYISKQLQNPNFSIITLINETITSRQKRNFLTNLNHVKSST